MPRVIIPLADPILSPDSTPLALSFPRSPDHRTVLPHARVRSPMGEREPLLTTNRTVRKPFFRPRPLWLVPFALISALVRGMTVAPRVNVYTQLACAESEFKHSLSHYNHVHPSIPIPIPIPTLTPNSTAIITPSPPGPGLAASPADTYSKHHTSSKRNNCPTAPSPPIQARAARLQTTMTTTMGILSALTTAWWGQFGERYGRMKVLAISSLGVLVTDLTFILIIPSPSSSPSHAHHLLLLAQILEGLLGGWPALQSALMAYIADCTQSSATFARFTGVVYVGSALGPIVGAFVMRHPGFFRAVASGFGLPFGFSSGMGRGAAGTVTSVFGAAALCTLINILLVAFVFPESLPSKDKEELPVLPPPPAVASTSTSHDVPSSSLVPTPNEEEEEEKPQTRNWNWNRAGPITLLKTLLNPLFIFLPQAIDVGPGMGGKRTDWSLTVLGVMAFGYMLGNGIIQMKYMYASHTYGWGAEQLSYYISWLGGLRAVHLLFILPFLITTFKPKPKPKSNANPAASNSKSKPKPTKARLVQEIHFGLLLTRLSLLIEVLMNVLIVLTPVPGLQHTLSTLQNAAGSGNGNGRSTKQMMMMFLAASSMGSFASGTFPAVQNLALCILQLRGLYNKATNNNNDDNNNNSNGNEDEDEDGDHNSGSGNGNGKNNNNIGALFGALAVLQAMGQMILGPLLFGLVYSSTVGTYPKAIFVGAAGAGVGVLALAFLVRPVGAGPGVGVGGKARRRRAREVGEVERGRSRVSKDLSRGGGGGVCAVEPEVASGSVGPS